MKELTMVNCVDIAQGKIETLYNIQKKPITTSKIRNLLSNISDIYNVVVHYDKENLTDEIKAKIQYLKIQFVYESGRDVANKGHDNIKNFIEYTELIPYVEKIDTKEKFMVFERYVEALVAYHKFLGGKD